MLLANATRDATYLTPKEYFKKNVLLAVEEEEEEEEVVVVVVLGRVRGLGGFS